MVTAEDHTDEAMITTSIALIRRSHGKAPVVYMRQDAPSNLQRIHLQTRSVIHEAVRVDFVRNSSLHIGGIGRALVYNAQDDLIIRIDNALLGYEGSGSRLSQRLLELLGAPPEAFLDLNELARNRTIYGVTWWKYPSVR